MDFWRPIRPGDAFPDDESYVSVNESCLALAFRDKGPASYGEPVFGRAWRDPESGAVRCSFPWGGQEFGNADLGSTTFYLLKYYTEGSPHRYVWLKTSSIERYLGSVEGKVDRCMQLVGLFLFGIKRSNAVAVERFHPALMNTGAGVHVLGKADLDGNHASYAESGREITLTSEMISFKKSKVLCRKSVLPPKYTKVKANQGRALQVMASDIVAAKINRCLPLDWLVKSGKPPVVGNLGFRQHLQLLGSVRQVHNCPLFMLNSQGKLCSRGMRESFRCRMLLSTDGERCSSEDNPTAHVALGSRLQAFPWQGLRELRLRLGCCGLEDVLKLLLRQAAHLTSLRHLQLRAACLGQGEMESIVSVMSRRSPNLRKLSLLVEDEYEVRGRRPLDWRWLRCLRHLRRNCSSPVYQVEKMDEQVARNLETLVLTDRSSFGLPREGLRVQLTMLSRLALEFHGLISMSVHFRYIAAAAPNLRHLCLRCDSLNSWGWPHWDPHLLTALSGCTQLQSLRLRLRCTGMPRELCLVQSSLQRLCLWSHRGLSLALTGCPRLSVLRLDRPEDRSGPKHQLRSRPPALRLLELSGAASDEPEEFVESADLLGEAGLRLERVQERAERQDEAGWW